MVFDYENRCNTIENIQVLETILSSLKTVVTIDQLRQIYQSDS